MKNIIKKIFSLAMMTAVLAGFNTYVTYAEDETELVNIALSENNPYVSVSSATHPSGGIYKGSVKPLSGLTDGIKGDVTNALFLVCPDKSADFNEVYAPYYNPDCPLSVCVDLGMTYDIEKLVLHGRTGANVSLSGNTRIYGSNDPKAATADWKNAKLHTIKDFGTGTTANGNNLTKNGKVTFTFDGEHDDDSDMPSTKDHTNSDIQLIRKSTENSFRYIVIARGQDTAKKYFELTFGELEIFVSKETVENNDNGIFICNRTIKKEIKEIEGKNTECFVPAYNIKNTTDSELNLMIMLAAYDVNNKMTGIQSISVPGLDPGEIEESDGSLMLPCDGTAKVRLFVWGGTTMEDAGEYAYSAGMTVSNE